jgi:23S rRNA (adenine2503-C2)-methyltransferase
LKSEGTSLSLRERDGAKRRGEGRQAETFILPALTRASPTLSRRERASACDGFHEPLDWVAAELRGAFCVPSLVQRFISSDGTQRYLLRLEDGELVESVLIPRDDRVTFCISSQVGCSLGCSFCLTGQLGLTRNLSAGEIVSQVLLLMKETSQRFSVVLMGMGEPLQNYESVLQAIRILHDDRGLKVPMTRITVSTAGLVPGIERLAREPLFPNLSISLTGVTNQTRDALMPINRKYPIEALIESIRSLPLARRKRVMFECVMIKGLTDSLEDARQLSHLLRGMRVKVNLIPLNPSPEIPFERSEDAAILRFQEVLVADGTATFIRKSRGNDVSGACGQLKKCGV